MHGDGRGGGGRKTPTRVFENPTHVLESSNQGFVKVRGHNSDLTIEIHKSKTKMWAFSVNLI